eukprot:UN26068
MCDVNEENGICYVVPKMVDISNEDFKKKFDVLLSKYPDGIKLKELCFTWFQQYNEHLTKNINTLFEDCPLKYNIQGHHQDGLIIQERKISDQRENTSELKSIIGNGISLSEFENAIKLNDGLIDFYSPDIVDVYYAKKEDKEWRIYKRNETGYQIFDDKESEKAMLSSFFE